MSKFPSKIQIVIHIESDGGFWAEFPQLPGCYTQGDSLDKLPGQVNDALLTYFDIPRKQARKLNYNIEFEGKGVVRPQLKPTRI